MKKQVNYEQALAQVDEFLSQLREGKVSLADVSSRIAQARDLLEQCRQQLYALDKETQNLLQSEVVGNHFSEK